jgi:hypothetical protein
VLDDLRSNFGYAKRGNNKAHWTMRTQRNDHVEGSHVPSTKNEMDATKGRSTLRSLIVLIGIMVAAVSASILFA